MVARIARQFDGEPGEITLNTTRPGPIDIRNETPVPASKL